MLALAGARFRRCLGFRMNCRGRSGDLSHGALIVRTERARQPAIQA